MAMTNEAARARRERRRGRRQHPVVARRGPAMGWRPFLVLAGGLVVLVAILAAAGFLFSRPASVQPGAQLGVAVPDEGRQHVSAGVPIQYQHYPPASGPHYPAAQPWGVYQEEVPEGAWVHNLEHGGVVLLYTCSGDECAQLANQIRGIAQRLPATKWRNVKFLATPYGKQSAAFTLVAWNRQQTLATLDENSIRAFYQAYVDKGPEDAP